MICDNVSVNEKGHLTFAGLDTVELAEKYGTPLYLMDENKIRQHVRTYKNAMAKYMPEGSLPEFASKAFSCKQIYRIMAEEGADIDVVSCGEIYTAFSAGFPMKKAYFHGNNKTDSDIRFAIERGVGYFVIDNEEEMLALNNIAGEMGITQKALLRVTPGIDPHTLKKISTGSVESKFGIAIETGQAKETTKKLLSLKNIKLCGFHCHIGSQIFESEPFVTASEIMLKFSRIFRAPVQTDLPTPPPRSGTSYLRPLQTKSAKVCPLHRRNRAKSYRFHIDDKGHYAFYSVLRKVPRTWSVKATARS